jgi:hypothetical protein
VEITDLGSSKLNFNEGELYAKASEKQSDAGQTKFAACDMFL